MAKKQKKHGDKSSHQPSQPPQPQPRQSASTSSSSRGGTSTGSARGGGIRWFSSLFDNGRNHHHQDGTDNTDTSVWLSLQEWLSTERQGIAWVVGCLALGCLFGFGIGSGWLTGDFGGLFGTKQSNGPVLTGDGHTIHFDYHVAPWRIELGARIRASAWYQALQSSTDNNNPRFWSAWWQPPSTAEKTHEQQQQQLHPSHPRIFAVLREAIVREQGGYVHADLGPLTPAPSGASRGIGMVRESYHKCQTKCFPGVAKEKWDLKRNQQHKRERNPYNSTLWLPPIADKPVYKQEEVLLRVPLSFQMTRQVALDTILARLPGEVQRKASPHELDDAALLVLLLAHERGVGRHSRWLPYIASLPKEPSCGYSTQNRPYLLDSLYVYQEELGVDVYGWKDELHKAFQHASKIVNGLNKDYGPYLKTPEGVSMADNLHWALCHVTSRATAGSEKYGALRLVPMADMINHDANAGGFVELTGKERMEANDFIDAEEADAGTFVIRSLRHGRRKALRKGQELLVNYNVPHYSPLDWFVSLGFVPPERQKRWQKIDPALPRIRRDAQGGGAANSEDSSIPPPQRWQLEYGPIILKELKEMEQQPTSQPRQEPKHHQEEETIHESPQGHDDSDERRPDV